MNPINPAQIRYIKLGRGGQWVRHSLERGEIHFGYRKAPHELCAQGEWESVLKRLAESRKNIGKARDALREVRDFYTLGADCLWITLAEGHLWWAFAYPEVTWLGEAEEGRGTRCRKTLDGWRKTDIKGEPLGIDRLSTRLTQVGAYRQTLCSVKASDYLIRRINAVEEPVLVQAREAKARMLAVASTMIAGLHWSDFETMVDLIFSRSGWQRVSRVGETQKDIDLALTQPTTGERAFVQVKSQAGQAVFDDYVTRFRSAGIYDRMFFVCHSPKGELIAGKDHRVHVWTGTELADAVLRAGLYDWMIERSG